VSEPGVDGASVPRFFVGPVLLMHPDFPAGLGSSGKKPSGQTNGKNLNFYQRAVKELKDNGVV